jgi:uncharacterized protein
MSGLLGGILIGISATLLLAFNGRLAGISGILNRAIEFKPEGRWCWLFLAGMLVGGGVYTYILAPQSIPKDEFAPLSMAMGGLLVGFGTRMGNGCTSGHGVCGLGRLSWRSLVAVITFLSTAMLTVFLTDF